LVNGSDDDTLADYRNLDRSHDDLGSGHGPSIALRAQECRQEEHHEQYDSARYWKRQLDSPTPEESGTP
jgi:hypothetical protein